MTAFPRRGEVWLVNWNPARGSKQAGKRPALIVQNDIGNEHGSTTIIAAISTRVRLYPMNVQVDPPQGGLTRISIIKTGQLMTVTKDRLEKKMGAVDPSTMEEVGRALRLSLAL